MFLMDNSKSTSNDTFVGKYSFIFEFNFIRFSKRIFDQSSKVRLGFSSISF